jgi:hypothetical protein
MLPRKRSCLWIALLCLLPAPSMVAACGGDICQDLLTEEQACSTFTKPTPPAGEACTDKRGVYAQCVLDSGADLCAALADGDSAAKMTIASTCGQPPL